MKRSGEKIFSLKTGDKDIITSDKIMTPLKAGKFSVNSHGQYVMNTLPSNLLISWKCLLSFMDCLFCYNSCFNTISLGCVKIILKNFHFGTYDENLYTVIGKGNMLMLTSISFASLP